MSASESYTTIPDINSDINKYLVYPNRVSTHVPHAASLYLIDTLCFIIKQKLNKTQ